MGDGAIPKQYIEIDRKPILIWTLEIFEKHPLINEVYLACKEDWIAYTHILLKEFKISKVKAIVPGGETSQHSIYNALVKARYENTEDTVVLIHDGVPPFVSSKLIVSLVETARDKGNAITYTPCQETIVISTDEEEVDSIPIRRHTLAVQAPQAFFIDDIIGAHDEIRKANPSYEDIVEACTLYSSLGKKINLVLGNRGNIKVTKPEDTYILKGLMKFQKDGELLGLPLLEI